MTGTGYTFGDSPVAASRLELLADVFSRSTTAFVAHLPVERPDLVVDLGCGPGFTTTLLHDVLAPSRVIGIDASTPFVEQARQRLGAAGDVLCGDVRDLPREVDVPDVIFARFLLTHLPDPNAAIEHWLARLGATGVVALEEVESITTDEPVLARYLELQRQMLRANDNRLEVGPVIANFPREQGTVLNSTVLNSTVAWATPEIATAARMFAMNFANWRRRPAVRRLAHSAELDEIATGLVALAEHGSGTASITWQLRQVSLTQR